MHQQEDLPEMHEQTTENVAQIYIDEGVDMTETDPSSLSQDNRTVQSQE